MTKKKKTKKQSSLRQFLLIFFCLVLVFLAIGAGVIYSRHRAKPLSDNSVVSQPPNWRLSKVARNHQIEGYASTDSTTPGSTVNFQVSCHTGSFVADVYRMGWYAGSGAKLATRLASHSCHKRSIPRPDKATGLVNADWPTTFRLYIPSAWASGIYLVKLTAADGYQNYIPFTIKSTQPKSKFLFVHSINTDNAYNLWGGNSLYKGFTPALNINRAVKASLNRPFIMPNNGYDGSGDFLIWEYPMIRFLEKYHYQVDYATDIDVQKNPKLLLKYKAIIVTGHNEYWSKQIRDSYDSAVDYGVNLAVFAANTGFRPVRFEPDPYTGAPDRIMVNYKSATLDPYSKTNPQYSTPAAWRLAPLNEAESGLLGIAYEGETSNEGTASGDLVVSDASSWIFKGSGLKNGDKIPGIVGYEYDRFNDSLPHPSDLDLVFHSPLVSYHNKEDFADGSVYTATSGAQVFDAGTMEWSWGLDSAKTTYSSQLVKVTQNILNRFGSGPTVSHH